MVRHSTDDRIGVLILIKGLGIGGAETLVADAAELWDRTAFDYRVAFLLPWKDQLQPRLESAGVGVVNLDWRGPRSFGAIRRLRHLFTDFRPQIVHSHLPAAGVLARLALPDATHVYTEHNITHHYRQPTRALNRLTYSRNRSVVAVSEAVARSVASYGGPNPDVIPNGVQVEVSNKDVDSVRAELGVTDGTQLIVHVGNIRPYKGHSNLIAATQALLRSHPRALVVSVGGEKRRGDQERLESDVEARGIAQSIRFLGRRPDARAFLAAADCVVSPSDVEGLPVVLLEALALERPVVATDVGGVASVIKHEVTGLLVAPQKPASLAAAIARCLDSPDAALWASQGKRLVEAEYGLQTMVDRYQDLYRRVVNG